MKNDTITIMNDTPKLPNVPLRVPRKDAYIQLRLTPDLKKALDQLAKANGVTVARLFEYALAQTYPELKDHLPKL